MTALPLPRPRLLTVAEFYALGEVEDGRYELQEGNVVMAQNPDATHQAALSDVMIAMADQVPDPLRLIPSVDVDMELAPPNEPGFVRVPDFVVITTESLARRRADDSLLRASEIVLAVEITTLGSRRTDHIIKRDEYADAGIPHYWILDIDDRPTLTAHHLAGEFGGYATNGPVTGTFTATEPFPIQLDLDKLSG